MATRSQLTDEALPILPSTVQHDEILLHAAIGQSQNNTKGAKRETLGRLLQVVGALCFALGDISTRYLQTHPVITSEQIMFCTSFALFVCALIYIICIPSLRTVFSAFKRSDFFILCLRGFSGAVQVYSLVRAFEYIPAGDATAVLFSGPIMLIFLSNLFLGEPISKSDIVAGAIGFIGVLLISRSNEDTAIAIISSHDRIVGTSFALTAAIATCFTYITMRKLVTSVHFMTSTLSLGFSALVMSAMLGGTVTPTDLKTELGSVVLAFMMGFVAFVGQVGISYGLQFCHATTAYLLSNLEVIFVYAFGLIFLQEVPTPLRAFGALLVVSGAFMVSVDKIFRATKESQIV